jgi:L-threonylcarbamoyladenylate synthase
MVRTVRANPIELATAVQALRDGEPVAFPTETVYGLGAHAGYPAALRRIFELKGRPTTHPLIVHIDSARYLTRWAREVPEAAARLAECFWPGPLTLVLPRAENVHRLVTGGQDTVAVRVPSHPMAQQLLTAFGGGIAAPSANRYGRVSPTRAEHVREEFGAQLRVVLDGGDCKLGLESTIVACLDGKVQLLRPGSVTLSQLERVVGEVQTDIDHQTPRVPGSGGAHYAPSTPLSVVGSGELEAQVAALTGAGMRVGVLAQHPPMGTYRLTTWINGGVRPESYAHDLYANLRTLDKAGCARILVSEVPADERWDAAYDRLQRAAALPQIEPAEPANDSDSLAVGVPR